MSGQKQKGKFYPAYINVKYHLYAILIPLFIGIIIAAIAYYNHLNNIENLKTNYTEKRHQESLQVKKKIEHQFSLLYTGVRTIARLPCVKQIQSTISNKDAITAIQELYNNMASELNVSEIYITASDFTPNKINPETLDKWEPMIMFDHLIVGQTKSNDKIEHNDSAPVEEVEEHEYNLIHSQIKWFKEKWPTDKSISSLNHPAISGNEVLTCDNRNFDPKKPNNKDRSGIVYSVPFYTEQGEFKGVVSSILLSNVIRSWLPNNNHIIYNDKYNFIATHTQQESIKDTSLRQQTKTEKIYSETLSLDITDGDSKWFLWSGIDDNTFWTTPLVQSEEQLTFTIYLIDFLITIFLIFYLINYKNIKEEQLYRNLRLEIRISERTNELETSRNAAQTANQAKSAFLSNMSHELRTPIHAILSYSNFGRKRDHVAPEKRKGYFEKIYKSGSNLLGLLNNLLDLSKLESGKMEFHLSDNNIVNILLECIDELTTLSDEKDITISKEISETIRKINCDPISIAQVFRNLISNAIKFSPEKGKISISLLSSESIKDKNKKVIRFSIKDEGIGIPKDELETVFDKFIQSSKTNNGSGGTGLGLSICREIIQAHSGYIWAEQNIGDGVSFIFELLIDDT